MGDRREGRGFRFGRYILKRGICLGKKPELGKVTAKTDKKKKNPAGRKMEGGFIPRILEEIKPIRQAGRGEGTSHMGEDRGSITEGN